MYRDAMWLIIVLLLSCIVLGAAMAVWLPH